jgi:CheY-like chemotaxis protein/nitrogen-specific signal transduction histidine kinase
LEIFFVYALLLGILVLCFAVFRLARDLARAKKSIEDARKEKTDFLAIVSHEIRTPMTGIMGMIRLLMDTSLTPKQKEYADTLQYSCNALLALINDILDFSKVGVKKMDIETISFDLNRLIEGVVPLMSSRADEKKITLKTDVDPKTPRILKGDPTRIRQILLNLIGNAIKFTDKGSVTLIVKPVGRDENGRHKIYFAVKDTGIGMSPEVQKTVFVPYAQGHASIARRYGGTGLGLSISQQLTAAMGGMVEMSSAVGAGTTFYFTLAFEEATAVEEDASAAQIEAKPIKILVVDDNLINQKVVSGILEKDKHTIVTVSSAKEALEQIGKITFDVILMDMEMPDIDGPTATRMIRALPDKEKASIPVVAMTSNTSREDLETCFKAGMNASCSKPINIDQLRALMLQVANKEGPFNASGKPAIPASAPEKAVETAKPAARLFDPETLGTLKTSMSAAQLDDMMKSFYDKTDELIAAAEKAVADKDYKALAGRAHDIKGMTSNFGLMALSEVGAQIDHQAKENAPIETIAQTVNQLRPVYAETRKTIDEWIKA